MIHTYANTKKNALVMTHEILHTVSASDRYGPNNQLIYPEGCAQPDKIPLYPQRFAEIMADRTPISKRTAKMPISLRHVVVGEKTAKEINWLPSP